MKRMLKTVLTAALVAGLGAPLALAADNAAPIPAPPLAPNVKPQAGYEAAPQNLVVANPTSIHVDITPYSAHVAELDNVGERINALAKVKDWDWILVGRDGVGIGYVSRNMLTEAKRR